MDAMLRREHVESVPEAFFIFFLSFLFKRKMTFIACVLED